MIKSNFLRVFCDLYLRPLFNYKNIFIKTLFWTLIFSVFNISIILIVEPFLKFLTTNINQSDVISVSELFRLPKISIFEKISEVKFNVLSMIYLIPIFMIIAITIAAFSQYRIKYLQELIAVSVANDFRKKAFENMIRQPYKNFVLRTATESMAVLMNDILFYQQRFSEVMSSLFKDVAVIIAGFTALLIISPLLSGVYLLFLPFIIIIMLRVGWRVSRLGNVFQLELKNLLNVIFDLRKRHEFIRAEKAQMKSAKDYGVVDDKYKKTIYKIIPLKNMVSPLVEICAFGLFVVFLILFQSGVLSEYLDPVNFIQYIVATALIIKPIRNIAENYSKVKESVGVLEPLVNLLTPKQNSESDQAIIEKFDLPITIEKAVLKLSSDFILDVKNIKINRAQFIAIIGKSGSGKSSMLKLLSGLYVPDEWRASIAHQALAGNSCFSSQVPFIFSDTVFNNIVYGDKSNITIVEARARANLALEYSGIFETDIPVSKADFLDMELSSMKTALSGGQKQMLAAARCIYSERDLLLLDEPTSAFDLQSERLLYLNLRKMLNNSNRIVLAITHRLSLLDQFDHVIYMSNGHIIAQGAHQLLLSANSDYREFCIEGV